MVGDCPARDDNSLEVSTLSEMHKTRKIVEEKHKHPLHKKERSRTTIRRPPHDVADAPPPPPPRFLFRWALLARAPPVLGRGPARFLELAPQGIEVVGVVGLGRERDVDADLRRIVILDCGLHNQSRPPDDEAAAVVARDETIDTRSDGAGAHAARVARFRRPPRLVRRVQ